MHAWLAVYFAFERHELDFLYIGLTKHSYLIYRLRMACRSMVTRALSIVQASSSNKTAAFIASPLLERKGFSREPYNALPDFTAAEQIVKQRDANAIVRNHLVPLPKRYKLSAMLISCLIYKQLPLGLDERIVMAHKNENLRWKVCDFLGRRDQAVSRTIHICDRAYSSINFCHRSGHQRVHWSLVNMLNYSG